MVALSMFPVFCATSSSSMPAEYASAEVLSIPSADPPYLAVYAAMNSLLPATDDPGYQSPVLKTPAVLPAPTLSGNSVGEFAPLDMKSHLGLNFSWIMALICANA